MSNKPKIFYKYIIQQRTDGGSWEEACDSYEDDEIEFKTLSTCKKRAYNDMNSKTHIIMI